MFDFENMTIEDIETRTSEIVAELADACDERIGELNAELDALQARKTEIVETRKADIEAVVNKNDGIVIEEIVEERNNEKMEIRNSKEYIDAYANYIKTGDATECRALLTENVSGTVAVPDIVDGFVGTAWERTGIMALVRKAYMRGNVKIGFEISADGAVVHTEGSGEVDEESLVLGIASLVPKSIKKWISISDEVYDLGGEEFLRYIYDELTYRIAKAAEDALIAAIDAAPATNQSGDTVPAVPVVDADSIAMGTIATALGQLSDEASNPVVVMNKSTWAAFKAAQYAGSFAADIFEGMDVYFNNSIKAFDAAGAGETYAIVGDFGRGALANFPNGEDIDIKLDDRTLMTSDLVRILGRQFVGIGVVAPNAFVKIAKSESE